MPATPAPSESGSGPALRIAPARQVVGPISFETARGDESSARTEAVRRGTADVRLEVFVIEQQVPLILEIDAKDDEATTVHVLARGADGTPLAAGRLLIEPDHPGQVHLGRLAVRLAARGTGLGARMVAAIEQAALDIRGEGVAVVLSAQEQAMGFYERCGYRPVTGESYMDAGIPHQDMARTLSRGAR
ncbi:GNAT family N-acetyltransferase [Actinomyces bowdenii]|uniref:GNAT family N-acetyltransferase n=1 Tax=Actinomyces bowdenii TaxID=131109 RepID=UPI001ABC4166|nr:GNAT family N-acetyltransferase [Actinomyces bowdenii]MBO3724309.1 GNAT family N-acetyltransferase [Actinomyces bowdenii]